LEQQRVPTGCDQNSKKRRPAGFGPRHAVDAESRDQSLAQKNQPGELECRFWTEIHRAFLRLLRIRLPAPESFARRALAADKLALAIAPQDASSSADHEEIIESAAVG
jgi:hypothetical protein